jgi:chromosome segregation ATPase
MKNRVSSLEAQLSQAKEELNNVHDKEVFNNTKLTSILASIDEATEDLKQKETSLKLSTNNFNAAVRALQKF